MCCFARPVRHVADTSLFARVDGEGNQFLVYGMTMDSAEDNAMVLPIPVKQGAGEDAVRFIDLEKYPTFFKDLDRGFPVPPIALSRGIPGGKGAMPLQKLEVHQVGAFEASFVPSVAEFNRLDRRFRLPDGVWEKLPQYARFGFAVFKLRAGNSKVHPMAFSFPAGNASKVFFPTVHIHDGEVHDMEEFDHSLYCQTRSEEVQAAWKESNGNARQFVEVEKSKGVISADRHVYKKTIRGRKKNGDVVVPAV